MTNTFVRHPTLLVPRLLCEACSDRAPLVARLRPNAMRIATMPPSSHARRLPPGTEALGRDGADHPLAGRY